MQLSTMLSLSNIASQSRSTSNLIHEDYAPIKAIRALPGAAAAPSMSFAQDTDTGIFNASANTIGIAAGGNPVFVATPSNVLAHTHMTVCSNIMPVANAVQMIGSSNMHFKEAWIDTIHISQNTLYLGDTPVLGTDSDSIAIRADLDQSINIKTTGLGATNLTSTKGVNVAVSGLNSVVDVQSSGAGGRVVMGATTEVALNAPTTTIGSNLTVQGNLTVNGTQFTANVQTVEIQDNILLINKGQIGNGVSAGYAGIRVDRGDGVDYDLVFNETTDKFEMGPVGSLSPIATEAYALPKTGGTLTGALTGTSATFTTLSGGAISSSINSTASNVAASSAAVKAAYDRVGTSSSQWTTAGTKIYYSLGNVGINTNNPDYTLAVNGTFGLGSNGGILDITDQTTYRRIQTWSGVPLCLNPLGNRVGVGRTDPTYTLDVQGDIRSTGFLMASSVTQTSDDRVKSDEVYINDALSTLEKLKPQVYKKWDNMNYKVDSNVDYIFESGLIAQEVFYDAPELRHLINLPAGVDSNVLYSSSIQTSENPSIDPDYSSWGSNLAGVRYDGLIAYTVQAIKELNIINKGLEARIASLEAKSNT